MKFDTERWPRLGVFMYYYTAERYGYDFATDWWCNDPDVTGLSENMGGGVLSPYFYDEVTDDAPDDCFDPERLDEVEAALWNLDDAEFGRLRVDPFGALPTTERDRETGELVTTPGWLRMPPLIEWAQLYYSQVIYY